MRCSRAPHQVVGVVTQPDRPRGRGQKTTDAPVKARAVARGLADPAAGALEGSGASSTRSTALHADLGVVAAYGKILTDAVLATPRLGMINVHASMLPRYRGAAPVHRAVIAGERETGVTIMRVVKALDAGPMLVDEPSRSDRTRPATRSSATLARIGARLLVPTRRCSGSAAVAEIRRTKRWRPTRTG